MDFEGELRLLHPKRGDVLALYVDTRTVACPDVLGGSLAELRRAGVVILVLPADALLTTPVNRTPLEVLDEWVRPHGFRVVPR